MPRLYGQILALAQTRPGRLLERRHEHGDNDRDDHHDKDRDHK